MLSIPATVKPIAYPYTITGILAASELSLGSYLHLFHVPFTGQLMSLNQCFWLNVSKNWAPTTSTMQISLQVAAIKLMSPVGKRITPMMAISIQGLLFEMGYRSCGRLLGSIFLSLWSLLQPCLVYFLFFGNSLFTMTSFFSEKLGLDLYSAIAFIACVKIALASTVCLLAKTLSKPVIERYGAWIQKLETTLQPKKKSKSLFRSPLFYSLSIVAIYLYLTMGFTESFVKEFLFSACWIIFANYIFNLIQATLKNKIITRYF